MGTTTFNQHFAPLPPSHQQTTITKIWTYHSEVEAERQLEIVRDIGKEMG